MTSRDEPDDGRDDVAEELAEEQGGYDDAGKQALIERGLIVEEHESFSDDEVGQWF